MLEIKTFKRLAFFAVALAGLASCTSSDELGSMGSDVESDKTPITFDVPFIGKSSRGFGDLDETFSTIKSGLYIYIWGEKYKTGENDCETVYNHTSWKSLGTKYWEKSYKYDFLGMMWGDMDGFSGSISYPFSSTKLSERKLTVAKIPLVQTNPNTEFDFNNMDSYVKELLFATATNYEGSTPQTVQLTFHHAYSKLSVYAYTTTGTTTSISSLNIWLPKVADGTTATYTQTEHGNVAGTWTWTDENATSKSDATSESDLEGSYTKYSMINSTWSNIPKATNANDAIDATSKDYISDKSLYIAPTPESLSDYTPYLGITYTVDGEQKTKLIKLDAISKLEQGKKYNIALCLDKQEEIKFDYQVATWTPSQVEKDLTK